MEVRNYLRWSRRPAYERTNQRVLKALKEDFRLLDSSEGAGVLRSVSSRRFRVTVSRWLRRCRPKEAKGAFGSSGADAVAALDRAVRNSNACRLHEGAVQRLKVVVLEGDGVSFGLDYDAQPPIDAVVDAGARILCKGLFGVAVATARRGAPDGRLEKLGARAARARARRQRSARRCEKLL